jgi:hypothetical protein
MLAGLRRCDQLERAAVGGRGRSLVRRRAGRYSRARQAGADAQQRVRLLRMVLARCVRRELLPAAAFTRALVARGVLSLGWAERASLRSLTPIAVAAPARA